MRFPPTAAARSIAIMFVALGLAGPAQAQCPLFGAATNFAVGTRPYSVAIGEFNGDGRRDLAVANQNSDNVSILLGTGTGTFGSATNFAAGSRPFSVAIGDFNGDGRSDLATANFNSNNVSILLGTGTGTFGGGRTLRWERIRAQWPSASLTAMGGATSPSRTPSRPEPSRFCWARGRERLARRAPQPDPNPANSISAAAITVMPAAAAAIPALDDKALILLAGILAALAPSDSARNNEAGFAQDRAGGIRPAEAT